VSDFAHETTVAVRYRDLDAFGHVNNATYATYVEEARLDYVHEVLGVEFRDLGVVVASLSLDFEHPVAERAPVTVETRVEEIGESSLPMAHRVTHGGDVAATAETVLVAVDEGGRPRAVPADWREAVTDFEPHL